MNYVRLLLLCLVMLLALPAQRPAAAAVVDWRFGVVESYEDPAAAARLGVGWTRVRFHWGQTQAGGAGTWTPTVSDEQINGEIGAGRMVVGLLIGVPDWAWDNGLPAGLWLPHEDPGNTWAGFVREVVSRYNGRIDHWIIWNEPDVGDPGAPGFTWPGTVEDFVQLQRTAYLVAKAVNPNVTIHLPAVTYFWDPGYIYRLLDGLAADPAAAGHNHYFDVATAHLYFQPASVYDLIQNIYGAMSSRGIPLKPVWLVETNAPPMDDPAWPVANWTLKVTQPEQAAFIPQALALAMAAGAERIAVYKLKDTPDDVAANPEPFGLLRMDGSRRPAFSAYQVAIQYLAGAQSAGRERWDAVGQIRVKQPGYSTTVLFARLPAPQRAQVAATANSAVLVDMMGARRTITAADGVFSVDLPGALCSQTTGDYCMIGGAPLYLVQADEGGALPGAPPAADPPPAATAENEGPASTAAPPDTAVAGDATVERVTASATATVTRTRRPPRTATPFPSPTVTATATATPTRTATSAPTLAATEAAPTLPPTVVAPPALTTAPAGGGNGLSYWFIGGGLLLAVAVGGWWVVSGRK